MLDTCIVIDLLQKREPFFDEAHQIFLAVANQKYEGMIAANSVTDINYLMHRFLHSDDKTRKVLDTLFKLLHVLDTTEYDCKKALLSPVSDYEDALMVETALSNKMDYIVTRNIKDYAKAEIPVLSPKDFLKQIEKSSN